MRIVNLNQIAWIMESATRLNEWLVDESPGRPWSWENVSREGWYRWIVSWITYEKLYVDLWDKQWFQDGIKALGLLALEREHRIQCHQSDDGALYVDCGSDKLVTIDDFLAGESLPIRHDPEFADMSWSPVSSVGQLLNEYAPDSTYRPEKAPRKRARKKRSATEETVKKGAAKKTPAEKRSAKKTPAENGPAK